MRDDMQAMQGHNHKHNYLAVIQDPNYYLNKMIKYLCKLQK